MEMSAEPKRRLKLDEDKSKLIYKDNYAQAQRDLLRVQSECDNILDILHKLGLIDQQALQLVILGDKNGGLNEEDHIQIRSLKNVSSFSLLY